MRTGERPRLRASQLCWSLSLLTGVLAFAGCGGADLGVTSEPPAPGPSPAPTGTIAEAPPTLAGVDAAPPAPVEVEPVAEVAVAEAPQSPCGEGMAFIPGGTYEMRERKGVVKVEPFCLDVRLTTAAEYKRCIDAGACTQAYLTACDGETISLEGKADHPMVCIDMAQAQAYCSHIGKRLSMDEEWEWAARGGDNAWEFPWGNEAPNDQLCWSGNGTRKETCPVGAFPSGANPQGVLDMSGNVLEWTTTRYDARIAERAVRGGSWRDGVRAIVRSGRAGWFKPEYRCGFLGIRCATDAPAGAASAATPTP